MKDFLLGQNAIVNHNPEQKSRNAVIDLGASTNQLLWFVPYTGTLEHGIHLAYYDSFFDLEARDLTITGAWHEGGLKRLRRRQQELAALLQPFLLAP